MAFKHMLFSLIGASALASSAVAQEIPSDMYEEKPATPVVAPKIKSRADDYTLLKIDGEPVKYSEVEKQWSTLFGGIAAPKLSAADEKIQQDIAREIVSKHLVYNDAVRQGFLRNPDVLKKMEELKRQLIIQAYVEDKTRGVVTDAALKTAYDERTAKLGNQEEVRARHILVASEAEAKEIAKKLKDGADFEALAKEKSDDKLSGKQGGDLGYFTKDKMIPAFADAAFKLKKGEISTPIKSDFGWHIIKLEDKRKVQLPPMEQMKDALKEDILNKEVSRILEGLMARATVKYYGPDGKEKPFEKKAKAAPGAANTPAATPAN